jgi:hypothetical protein
MSSSSSIRECVYNIALSEGVWRAAWVLRVVLAHGLSVSADSVVVGCWCAAGRFRQGLVSLCAQQQLTASLGPLSPILSPRCRCWAAFSRSSIYSCVSGERVRVWCPLSCKACCDCPPLVLAAVALRVRSVNSCCRCSCCALLSQWLLLPVAVAAVAAAAAGAAAAPQAVSCSSSVCACVWP